MSTSWFAHRAGPVARLLAWASVLLLCAAGASLSAQEARLPRAEVYWHDGAVEPAGYLGASLRATSPEPTPAARPGLAERIGRITRGRTQIEGGYALVLDQADGVRVTQHAFGDLLVRFGLTDRLEIRFGWPGYVTTDFDGTGVGGSSSDTLEPNVGFMLDLWPQQGILPQTAVLAAVPLTLEGNPFALESIQPLSQLLYRWQLSDRIAWGGTTGMALFDVAGDGFVQFQQTVNLDGLVTRRLGLFAEWEMLVDHGSADDASQHMLGGGVSHLLTERMQITWKAGLGLNEPAPDFLADVRLSYRF
ncbi:MAG: transporter [Planctomycetes bacterium]|nr:transporter [Planctomycetota bacterium]